MFLQSRALFYSKEIYAVAFETIGVKNVVRVQEKMFPNVCVSWLNEMNLSRTQVKMMRKVMFPPKEAAVS